MTGSEGDGSLDTGRGFFFGDEWVARDGCTEFWTQRPGSWGRPTFRSTVRCILFLPLIFAACRAPGEVITSPLVDEVKTALDSTRAEAPRLVLGEEPTLPGGARAICYENYIVIMGKGREALDYYLAHELVHWYIDDSPYAGLPHFIEEGLADWISCEVTGVLEARITEAAQIGTLSIDPRHLLLEAEAFMQLPYDASVGLTRAGFDIVRRLGMDELRGLAQDDAAPLDYLDAAGVL